MFRELCGDTTLKNVVITTNMWENLPSRDIGEAREYELRNKELFFKPVLDKGAMLLRHNHTSESAHNVLRHIIARNPVTLQIQRELVIEGKAISNTSASRELNKQLTEEIEKHKREMNKVLEDMQGLCSEYNFIRRKALTVRQYQDAMKRKDDETKKELEDQARRHQLEIDRIRTDVARNQPSDSSNDQDFWQFLGHVVQVLPFFLM